MVRTHNHYFILKDDHTDDTILFFFSHVAIGSTFLTKQLGITNPIHRSKITLKAMDVVLFGPPKEYSSTVKDIILTTLLVIAITGLIYAYRDRFYQHFI